MAYSVNKIEFEKR